MATATGQYAAGTISPNILEGSAPVTLDLNSSGDKLAGIFIAPDGSQAITHIGFYCSALTGISPTYQVVLQGYNAAGGIPDGIDVGGGSPTLAPVTAVAATYHEIALSNPYTPTEGEVLAAILEYGSGTIDVSNFAEVHRSIDGSPFVGAPYALNDISGSWAKIAGPRPQICAVYADGHIVPGTEIIVSPINTLTGMDSTPDEIGNVWIPNDSGICVGVRFHVRMVTAAANYEVRLYNSANSVIASAVIDGEFNSSTGGNRMMFVTWEGVSVTGGEIYRPVLLPTTVNTINRFYGATFVNSAHRESWAGVGQYYTHRTNAGAWTDDTSSIRAITGILSDITVGGGGTVNLLHGKLD